MTAEHRQARRLGNPVRVRSLSVAVYIGVCVHGVIRSLGKPGKAEHKRRGCHTAPQDVSQNTDDVGTQKEPLPGGGLFLDAVLRENRSHQTFWFGAFFFSPSESRCPTRCVRIYCKKAKTALIPSTVVGGEANGKGHKSERRGNCERAGEAHHSAHAGIGIRPVDRFHQEREAGPCRDSKEHFTEPIAHLHRTIS